MDRDGDYKKLLAMVQTANVLKNLTVGGDGHRRHGVYHLDQVLLDNPWQLHAANAFQPTPMEKLDRLYFVFKLRKLVAKFAECPQIAADHVELDRLTRVLSMLRFGVPVNVSWHIKLTKLVHDGDISQAKLRRLLRCLNVSANVDGNLVLRQFHSFTRFLVNLIFILSVIGLLTFIGASIFAVLVLGSGVQTLLLGAVCSVWIAFPLAMSWWLGPYSERAVRKLSDLLSVDYS